jgi:hypothetical protein
MWWWWGKSRPRLRIITSKHRVIGSIIK